MANNEEPMDVDCIESVFDNKENSFHHSNVLPCTEKGYEELDVTELNMKLRYSITPGASPMSKSYTAYVDNRNLDCDESLNCNNENANLTRSLNSTITKNDSVIKLLKTLPLQTIPTEQILDNRSSVFRQLDSTNTGNDNNVTSTIINENLYLPSSSSSVVHTPEATTPTNLKNEEGSPIIRGLKSVFNMFRSSQSPIPPVEIDTLVKDEVRLDETYCEDPKPQTHASTPISAHRSRDGSSKRSSPLKDSIVFNDDLETELQWKDDTILFSEEKIPIHKLFLAYNKPTSLVVLENPEIDQIVTEGINYSTAEYMDISHSNSMIFDNAVSETHNNTNAVESDGEFQDCETTFTKNESQTLCVPKEKIQKDTLEVVDVAKETVNKITVIENNKKDEIIHPKVNEDVSQTQDITETIVHETTMTETADSSAITLDIPRDIIDNVSALNISSNYEILETKESAIEILSDINDNLKCFENQIQGKTLADLNMEAQSATVSAISKCSILEATSAVESMNANNNDSSKPKSLEISAEIFLEPNEDGAHSITGVEDKILQEKTLVNESNIIENINNEINQVTLSEVGKEKIQPKPNNITQLIENKNVIQNVDIGPENVFVLDKVPSMECSQKLIQDLEILENQKDLDIKTDSLKQNTYFPENAIDNTTNVSLVPENDIKIMQQSKLLNDCSALSKSLLAEEPANIPLPDNDNDFDIELESNTDKVVPILQTPPDVLETVESESKLDVTETLNTVLNSVSISENATAELTEVTTTQKQEELDETVNIINSLTEIIGESQNNTLTQSSENIIIDESQNFQTEEITCNNEMHVLPDIVNETIHNMSVDEIVSEMMNQSQLVSETHNFQNVVERVFDVKTEQNQITPENFGTSVVNSTTEQRNEFINKNKEHTDPLVVSTEIVDDVPEANLFQSKSNEIEDTLKEEKVLEVDRTQNHDINDASNIDEQLVFSENNSPYVSVIAETQSKAREEIFENIDMTSVAPSSPPIRSKGYNFNFDEMDDPFATKTKIRPSPPTQLIKPDIEDKINTETLKKVTTNRRRSQPPERKKPGFNKKKFNTTFDAGSATNSINILNDLNSDSESKNVTLDVAKNTNITIDNNNKDDKEIVIILDSNQVLDKMVEENIDTSSENVQSKHQTFPAVDTTIEISAGNKSSIESIVTATSELKTSSSEQSTYYSTAASSSDSSISKNNVFNLPEIEDKNFNPFATKSKMRQSPPLDIKHENLFATESKIRSSPDSSMVVFQNIESSQISTQNSVLDTGDKMDTEPMEKDSSYNVSNITSSSIEIENKNITVIDVNTEDEDTEEGPFLEAEDAIDKLLGIDSDDMMQFTEIPAQAVNENADDGELFIDAEAFEFLLNKNKSNVVSDSGKESLFLKFDPLFAKRISSDGVLSALNKVQKRQSTPTKPTRPSLRNEASPIAGSSTLNSTYNEETNVTEDSIADLNITVAKPMMVVTPAVNPAVTPRNKTTTPPRSNRRSITFTSPAMAVIDRLLSLSGNNSLLGQDTTITQASREHIEADLALTQLRELLAEKEISVYQLRSESIELKERLTTMETQVKMLDADGQKRLNKINELTDRLAEKTKVNKSMAAVVEEYERTIASLIAETEQDKKRHAEERIRLINERDEQTAHLASMEVSFSDLHSKYEKSKQIILSCKANEEACKKSIKAFEENLTKMQTNYEMLKQHATSKLNNANQELQKITKSHESEVLKLNAMIKRKEMHITSLEETLAQKTKANEELTAICDELINKVG